MKNYIKHNCLLTAFCVLLCLALQSTGWAAPLTIAQSGKSTFTIVVPKLAPVSVTEAAAEMQRDIAEATGAKLPIVKDDVTITSSFISLGATKQAQQAGISTDKIGYEGFRIITKNNNLFIIGIDTTTELSQWKGHTPQKITPHPEIPGPAYTDKGGFSNGTANGVYSFLENQLGVRWLFPGDLGRDVPTKSTFTLPELNHTVTPAFNYRIMTVIRGEDEWRARQKLGYSTHIQYEHSFRDTVSTDLYKTHPDWFPMINGKRPQPPARNYKLETTNPGLVKYFAEQAIAALKAGPEVYSYSISPSDGRGWSESPESKALYDPPPTPNGSPSMTPLVLKFYRDVCAIVEKEYPQGVLGGYLYQDFSYPPQKGDMKLPENFIPTYVGKSMGYSFYLPETRELEAKLLTEWAKVAPTNWYYYGMPTWLRESSAQVSPAAPKELNFLYHTLVKSHIKGAEIYGTYKWSQGALVNYINAKMLWNPTDDAVAIQRDWLQRAYGAKAGAIMETLYNKLDESWFSDYFRSPQSRHYNVSELFYRNTFGAHYPKMEKLFLEAWNQPMTPKQKERLDLIRQNMIALQFRLRNAGYLPPEYSSPLTRSAKEVFKLFTDEETQDTFSYILVAKGGGEVTPVKTELGQPAKPEKKATSLPNANKVLLYSTRDGEITLKPYDVQPGSSFLTYYLQDAKGKTFQRGFLANGEENAITFPVKANQPYYFSTQFAGLTLPSQEKWKISIPGGAAADAVMQDGVLYLQAENKSAPLYIVHSPELKVQVEAEAGGVILQTETDKIARNRELRNMRIAADKTLADALKRYQGDVVLSLNQSWKFTTDPQKEGDAQKYFSSEYDDKAWKNISAIGPWQINGFPDYHGTAWYRKSFTLSAEQTDPLAMGDKQLLLYFGAIDGDAQIYLNGVKIEDRTMALFSNGWEQPLAYNISGAVHTGENTLAIKITKDRLAAGLYRGVAILSGILSNQ